MQVHSLSPKSSELSCRQRPRLWMDQICMGREWASGSPGSVSCGAALLLFDLVFSLHRSTLMMNGSGKEITALWPSENIFRDVPTFSHRAGDQSHAINQIARMMDDEREALSSSSWFQSSRIRGCLNINDYCFLKPSHVFFSSTSRNLQCRQKRGKGKSNEFFFRSWEWNQWGFTGRWGNVMKVNKDSVRCRGGKVSSWCTTVVTTAPQFTSVRHRREMQLITQMRAAGSVARKWKGVWWSFQPSKLFCVLFHSMPGRHNMHARKILRPALR